MKRTGHKGFTMVELVIAMTAGVAIAMVAMFLYAPVRNWVFIKDRRGGMAEGSAAVMKITREIGRINNPSLITAMTATSLRFTDIDSAIVCFFQASTNILRGSGAAACTAATGDVLARNVQSITFTYLDKDGAVTAVAANVRIIKLLLVVTSGSQTIRLESSTRVRNFT